jgi:hypothetical protein
MRMFRVEYFSLLLIYGKLLQTRCLTPVSYRRRSVSDAKPPRPWIHPAAPRNKREVVYLANIRNIHPLPRLPRRIHMLSHIRHEIHRVRILEDGPEGGFIVQIGLFALLISFFKHSSSP